MFILLHCNNYNFFCFIIFSFLRIFFLFFPSFQEKNEWMFFQKEKNEIIINYSFLFVCPSYLFL